METLAQLYKPSLALLTDLYQLTMAYAGIKRFVNPHQYPVGLERNLHELRTELILKARGQV